MIWIESKSTKFTYNVYHLVKAFYPEEEIAQKVDEDMDALILVRFEEQYGGVPEAGMLFSLAAEDFPERADEKWEVTRRLYVWLSERTGRQLAWGMLTGVRPTKLITQKIEAGMDREEILRSFREEDFVSEEKAELAYETSLREHELLSKLDCEKGFSLYVGIPFCPSVCSYCSFSSSPLDAWRGRVDEYLDALLQEIRALGGMMRGRRPDTIYVGGGTPTTLEPEQLRRLMDGIRDSFDISGLLEFTVEAGRPDSITEEKLQVIREYPVTRISINPQTMQQKTLDLVGRRHSPEDVERVFYMAREMGFDNINMDLIAGLPGENREDMQDTLGKIGKLRPDSLTIHALAIKRAARFGQEGRTAVSGGEIEGMIEDGARAARRMGLHPYYLYRQKNIAGNFENVGYAEVDKAGIYNILIMEEKQTILGAGAGASTKIYSREPVRMANGKDSNLIRIENVKNITEYISRIQEMIQRKRQYLIQGLPDVTESYGL